MKFTKEGSADTAHGVCEVQEDTMSRTTRFNGLHKKFLKLAYDSCTLREIYDLVMNDVESIIEKVCSLKKNLWTE